MLNCRYDDQTGCGVQYLKCQDCIGIDRIIGARVVFCRTGSEFTENQVTSEPRHGKTCLRRFVTWQDS